jgi:hypothetical protein
MKNLICVLAVLILIAGCATTPSTSTVQPVAAQEPYRDVIKAPRIVVAGKTAPAKQAVAAATSQENSSDSTEFAKLTQGKLCRNTKGQLYFTDVKDEQFVTYLDSETGKIIIIPENEYLDSKKKEISYREIDLTGISVDQGQFKEIPVSSAVQTKTRRVVPASTQFPLIVENRGEGKIFAKNQAGVEFPINWVLNTGDKEIGFCSRLILSRNLPAFDFDGGKTPKINLTNLNPITFTITHN